MSYSASHVCITIIIACIYSPFVHVAKRVDDNNLYAAYPQYGQSTVWPGYGYHMDDGEEFAHGEQLCVYVCVYMCEILSTHITGIAVHYVCTRFFIIQMIQRVECCMNITAKMK